MRVDLPSGHWVEFRDPSTLTEGQRRPVRLKVMGCSTEFRQAQDSLAVARAGDAAPDVIRECEKTLEGIVDANDLAVMMEIADLMAAAMIEAADGALGITMPCTTEQLLNLPGGDYDAVTLAAGDFFGAFMGAGFSVSADPASPTSPSNA